MSKNLRIYIINGFWVLLFFWLPICSIYSKPHFSISLIAIAFYFMGANRATQLIVDILWDRPESGVESNEFTRPLSALNRIVYAVCVVYHKIAPFIPVYFAIQVASRLMGPKKMVEKKVKGKIKEEEETFAEQVKRKNIYLIGNLASLFFGILGGILIRVLFNMPALPYPFK